jgi:hypothetical protein
VPQTAAWVRFIVTSIAFRCCEAARSFPTIRASLLDIWKIFPEIISMDYKSVSAHRRKQKFPRVCPEVLFSATLEKPALTCTETQEYSEEEVWKEFPKL